jgi:hypothetical protein
MNAIEAYEYLTALRARVRESRRGSGEYALFRSAVAHHRATVRQFTDKLAERQRRAARIASLAEGGRVCVVSSGMDCDGSAWSGRVYDLPASVFEVERFLERQYEWADGPMRLELASPSECEEIEYESRDLALEAFEDGHPHCLYY